MGMGERHTPQEGVHVRALGGFEVSVAGRPVSRADWQRLTAERLFKLLLVSPGHRLSREMAAETLWPDSTPATGRTNLRKAIHFAHRALAGCDVLVGDRHAIALDPAVLDLDLDRLLAAFERVDAGRHGAGAGTGPTSAVAPGGDAASGGDGADDDTLETVLELGSADLLPDDLYEDWLAAPREQLASRWQRLAIDTARDLRARGRNDDAHVLVDQVLARDPTDEAAHRLAIELYAGEGRHHAARRQFELCRSALRSSLDVDPAAETVATFQAAERSAMRDGRPATATTPLVGRREELERVEPALDRVAAGRTAIVVIRGPAGIGKTRFLREVSAYGRSAGWRVLGWQAVESTRTEAFAPLRIGLTDCLTPDEIAGWDEPGRSGARTLVPSLGRPALTFLERSALLAAIVDAIHRLARRAPLVIAIDDLPWLDESSLALLAELVAGGGDEPILVAATYRDDEPVPEAAASIVEQARRFGGLELRLGPLARRDIEPLVLGHLGGRALHAEVGRMVFEHGGGNPLFCLAIVREACEQGAVRLQDGRWTAGTGDLGRALPESARQIAARRCASLPRPARELLEVAAELGQHVTFGVLAAALPDMGAGLIGALDDAVRSGLLIESGGGYEFAHPLYRLAVRSAPGLARRGERRLAIARALAGTAACVDDPPALESAARAAADPIMVAEHALAAAELGLVDAMPIAVAFGFAGADRRVELHDHDGAATLYERAIAIWRRLPPADASGFSASRAFLALGRLRAQAHDAVGASACFRASIDCARDADELANVYDCFADDVPYARGDFESAQAIAEEGLARLPETAVLQRARLSYVIGWIFVRTRRLAEGLAILEGVVRVLDGSADHEGAAKSLDALGMTLHYLGRHDEARSCVERALRIALESGSSIGEIRANLHLGVLLARGGEPGRALPLYRRAEDLSRLTGDRYDEALSAWALAEAADALGDYTAAVAARRRELSLLEAIGGNPHNAAMSHAHLAHLARLLGDPTAADVAAAEARRLAVLSPEPGYSQRIERAIAIERWSDVDT